MKLMLAMLPIIIYLFCFIKYEPYNYFGFQTQAAKLATPLERLRAFLRNPSENIVLGDSRMTHVDLDLAEQLTGKKWSTLSTGGQGVNLTYAFYEWAKSKVSVQNIIMDISFYQVREGNMSPNPEPVIYIAEHPLQYIVTRDYVLEAFSPWLRTEAGGIAARFSKCTGTVSGLPLAIKALTSAEDNKIEAQQISSTKYREDLIQYAQNNIYPGCKNYSISQDAMNSIIHIITDVQDNGGEIKILAPVVQESIWEYVIIPLGLEAYMEQYKNEIQKYTEIYDMEWQSRLSEKQDIFSDGFHFDTNETYQIYTRNLLGDTDKYLIIRGRLQ